MDAPLDEQTRARGAELALVVEGGAHGVLRRVLHVGVREHDVWALSAELEGEALERRRRVAHDEPPGVRAAGEADLRHVGVVHEGRAGLLAVAGDHVEHARRKPGFGEDPRQLQAGERGLLGRLEHHGVAGGECRGDLAGREQQREVPRDDRADHAEGLPHRVVQERAADGDGLAVQLRRPAREVEERVRRTRDVDGAGVRDGFSRIERLEAGQGLEVREDPLPALPEDPLPLVRIGARPGREGALRRGHREVHVGAIAAGKLRERLTGGRVRRGEGSAGEGRARGVVDPEVGHCGELARIRGGDI